MNETKKQRKGTWFLMVFIIPAAVLLTVAIVLMTVVEHPTINRMKDMARSLPVISNLTGNEAEAEMNAQIEQLQLQLNEHQQQLATLNQLIEEKDLLITELEQENGQLQEEVEQMEPTQTAEHTNPGNSANEVGQIYENMSAKNAARIIAELSIDETMAHLMQISSEHRGNIIARLDSERAAEIMNRLVDN
ncbi:magnesium transporter MgtE N-terminal domain-containing protein [Alkalihalobacillus sp. 1P02AB]|uniref:MotE family protein n=1 Tax=Alkalihalobacillus sp. 1P02AB TaxID=3132260 RepID=UPI0039A58BE5